MLYTSIFKFYRKSCLVRTSICSPIQHFHIFTAWLQYEEHGHIADSMLVNTILMLVYVTKFFWWEAGYWNTMDIAHDRGAQATILSFVYLLHSIVSKILHVWLKNGRQTTLQFYQDGHVFVPMPRCSVTYKVILILTFCTIYSHKYMHMMWIF